MTNPKAFSRRFPPQDYFLDEFDIWWNPTFRQAYSTSSFKWEFVSAEAARTYDQAVRRLLGLTSPPTPPPLRSDDPVLQDFLRQREEAKLADARENYAFEALLASQSIPDHRHIVQPTPKKVRHRQQDTRRTLSWSYTLNFNGPPFSRLRRSKSVQSHRGENESDESGIDRARLHPLEDPSVSPPPRFSGSTPKSGTSYTSTSSSSSCSFNSLNKFETRFPRSS
jgi:hypothetical protein